MKSISLIATGLLCSIAVFSQSMVQGYVYEDLNHDGKKNGKEIGIANVAVSNGKEVTATDKKGFYQLPVGNDNIIFVIKPAGYSVPVNARNQPLFYYIHKPLGSPKNFEYAGVSPTGPLPKLVNFALNVSAEPENFRCLVFGDPQPYSLQEIAYFSKGVVSEVKGIKNVAFGITLGDLVGNFLNLDGAYLDAVKEVGIPWYNVIGNHNRNFEAEADSLADETFEKDFGPANYSFNYGKAHFIVLDDILSPDPRGKGAYWGGLRPDQLDFIKNDLSHVEKDRLIVLSFHIPLYLPDGFCSADRNKLFELLKDYPHTLSLSAHTHIQQQLFYGKELGWNQKTPHHEYNAGTTCGDWYSGELDSKGLPAATMHDGTPQGYAFLNISGNQYTIDYKVVGHSADYQMNIFNPKVVAHNEKTSSAIFVNFFMGSQKDLVQYRVDGGKWKKMNLNLRTDPSYLDLLHRWDFTETLMPGRRPSEAMECSHLWKGNIPTDLPVGKHEIEVQATDMFGRQFMQKSTYRIEERK